MPDKAMVYRKAAEIIVRDGKCEGVLTENGETVEAIQGGGAVCALGACARAEYELYGTIPMRTVPDFSRDPMGSGETEIADPYPYYGFTATLGEMKDYKIWCINDDSRVSVEDIALLLKQRAEDCEAEGE